MIAHLPESSDSGQELDATSIALLRVCLKSWRLISGLTLTGLLVSLAVNARSKPIYSGSFQILAPPTIGTSQHASSSMIANALSLSLSGGNLLGGGSNGDGMLTQATVLGSQSVLESVFSQLKSHFLSGSYRLARNQL